MNGSRGRPPTCNHGVISDDMATRCVAISHGHGDVVRVVRSRQDQDVKTSSSKGRKAGETRWLRGLRVLVVDYFRITLMMPLPVTSSVRRTVYNIVPCGKKEKNTTKVKYSK